LTSPTPELNPANTLMEHSCRLVRPVCVYLRKEHGEQAFSDIAEAAGLPADYLMDEHNWMSHAFYKRFLEELVRYTGNPKAPWEAGLYAATPEGYGHLYWLLRAFGTPEMIYREVVRQVPKYTKCGTYEILELTKNKAVLALKHKPGYKPSELTCLDAIAELASIPKVQGSPPARAVEHQCQAHGADCCIYELRWVNKPTALGRIAGLLVAAGLVLLDGFTIGALFSSSELLLDILAPGLVLGLGYHIGALLEAKRSDRWNARLATELDRSLIESMEAVEQKFEDLRRARDEIVALKNDELRSKNAELAAVNERLVEAIEDLERIDTKKTESLRIVAHDLKTPLASICIYARMLTMYDDIDEEERQNFLGVMDKESLRLSGIVDRFLDLTRIETGTLRMDLAQVEIEPLLRHIGAVFQTAADANKATIVFEITKDLPSIQADEGRLGQVASNLLANACKFSPKGGTVLVRAALTGHGPQASIRISVADSGPGIPEALRESIYEKFFHAEDDGTRGLTGQGLGLFIANEIVKGHGGRLYHHSEPGDGTTFVVELPLHGAGTSADFEA
jgi:signal transduction histidine kinase